MPLKNLFIDENNLIEWDEMTDSSDDSFVNDATVTFDLKTVAGVIVGAADDVAMAYVAASDGKYQGTLTKAIAATLAKGDRYILEITAGGTVEGFRRIECVAVYHGAK